MINRMAEVGFKSGPCRNVDRWAKWGPPPLARVWELSPFCVCVCENPSSIFQTKGRFLKITKVFASKNFPFYSTLVQLQVKLVTYFHDDPTTCSFWSIPLKVVLCSPCLLVPYRYGFVTFDLEDAANRALCEVCIGNRRKKSLRVTKAIKTNLIFTLPAW